MDRGFAICWNRNRHDIGLMPIPAELNDRITKSLRRYITGKLFEFQIGFGLVNHRMNTSLLCHFSDKVSVIARMTDFRRSKKSLSPKMRRIKNSSMKL